MNCRASSKPRRFALALLLLILTVGCGQSVPEVAPVKGHVTLDDKPLAHAKVEFQPDDMKPPSTSATGDNGEYQLVYKRGVEGARLGHHRVHITATSEPNAPVIPNRYNTQSKLEAEVKPGQNEINFDLKSEVK